MNPFLAEIIMFGGNFAPRGWAFCDGQLLAINSNQALFSLLGTIYGGDGRTSFGLPDLRGRLPMHAGNGPGLNPVQLGQKGGANDVRLTSNNIPPHNHAFYAGAGAGTGATAPGQYIAANVGGDSIFTSSAPNAQSQMGNSIGNTGGGQAFNIMNPFLVVNFIIATQGVFPSRN